ARECDTAVVGAHEQAWRRFGTAVRRQAECSGTAGIDDERIVRLDVNRQVIEALPLAVTARGLQFHPARAAIRGFVYSSTIAARFVRGWLARADVEHAVAGAVV